MTRREREIESREEIDAILREADVCRLAMALDGIPYVIPLSAGTIGDRNDLHRFRLKLDRQKHDCRYPNGHSWHHCSSLFTPKRYTSTFIA